MMNPKPKSVVRSSKGNDYCPEVVSSSNVILEMFQLVGAGLPPSMSTEMFQTSIQVTTLRPGSEGFIS